MPLPWVRLDTSMPDNPKILRLSTTPAGKAAAFVWLCSLAYAGKHGTDGFIPAEALTRVNGTAADARRLVEYGLWDVAAKGWQIHGYEEYQMLVATEIEMRQAASIGGLTAAANMTAEERSARASAAAKARWNGHSQ